MLLDGHGKYLLTVALGVISLTIIKNCPSAMDYM